MENETLSEKKGTNYEIMLILFPNMGEEQTNKELTAIKGLITSEGGEFYHEDIWGMRDFAYMIKKQERGFYVVLNFVLEPGKLKEIENPLNLNQKLIRYLIVKTPNNYEIRTLEEYEVEAEKETKEKEAEKEKAEKSKGKRPPVKRERKIVRKKVEEKETTKTVKVKKEKKEKEEVVEEEIKKEKKPEEKKMSKEKLDEVDERLRNIINDPDISL
ncbi:MAG: 30S ribosomal protein S6 [Candidatus Gracilibacteria bacterium]|jgi:small subunit ribosomal protein S6